jgi:dipeptidyl aminopeptidase/acylaminoacyl peptidase
VLAVLLLAGLAAAYVFRPVTPAVTRFFVFPPDKATFVMIASAAAASGAISPDGRTLAFTARDDAGKILLWVRPIDALAAQPLVGTDNAASPFWSPDSRFIAYFASGKVLKISASGGPPQTVSEPAGNRGGAWSRDGVIVFNTGQGLPFSRVSSAGGQASQALKQATGQESQTFPSFLPDGRHVLLYNPEQIPAVCSTPAADVCFSFVKARSWRKRSTRRR